MQLLDETGVANSPEAQSDSPEVVHERRLRYLREMELRLHCIQVERDTLYAERQAHRINDAMLRALVQRAGYVGSLAAQALGLRPRCGSAPAPRALTPPTAGQRASARPRHWAWPDRAAARRDAQLLHHAVRTWLAAAAARSWLRGS